MHRTNVPDVLEYWVLELELPLEKDLSPVRLIRVSEDPSFVILGLDDEDAVPIIETRM